MAYSPRNPNVTPAENLANTASEPMTSQNMVFDGTTWDRMRSNDSYATASATPDVGIPAVLMPDKRYNSQTLATAVNSDIQWDAEGVDSFTIVCQTATTGTFTFEVTADGTNWYGAEVRQSNTDTWLTGTNITPVVTTFRVLTIGVRTMRIRAVTTLGATVTVVATASARTAFVTAIKTGPGPHSFGWTPVHKDAEYTTTQTGAALWTPTTGKKFVITDITIATGGTTAGVVTIWQSNSSTADTTYTAGTDYTILRAEFAPSATAKPGLIKSFRTPYVATLADYVVRVTTSAGITVYIQVEGYEI